MSVFGMVARRVDESKQRRSWNRYLRRWRLSNTHNRVVPRERIPLNLVTIGAYSYGELSSKIYRPETVKAHLSIGNFVSISSDVTFVLDGNHPLETFTTFPLRTVFASIPYEGDAISRGNITVEDEVWIGYRATILSGIRIGRGAVIAAGAVVTQDIPPFCIAGGVPAKVRKFRFSEDLRARLERCRLIDLPIEVILRNLELFYTELDDETMRHIERLYQD